MEKFLLNINFTEQTIYLAIVLLVIGEGLKSLSFISKKIVIWILLIISMVINFIFYGLNIYTFIESILATSLAVFIYDLIKASIKKH